MENPFDIIPQKLTRLFMEELKPKHTVNEV
jgi:hypothetical protein